MPSNPGQAGWKESLDPRAVNIGDGAHVRRDQPACGHKFSPAASLSVNASNIPKRLHSFLKNVAPGTLQLGRPGFKS